MIKSVFNWSGGKDSALALHHVLKDDSITVDSLLTTINGHHQRISMHGVRRELLHAQAKSIGIPLDELLLPEMPSMDTYNLLMGEKMDAFKRAGITESIFGDIFLEDLKQYREEKLAQKGLKARFPLWKRDTSELIREFLDLGFKTVVVCIKDTVVPEEFLGRVIDLDFIKDLPSAIDPCGENGEFHTFVFDGPIFTSAIPFTFGEKVLRRYEAPKDQKDSCYSDTQEQPKAVGFHFQDLKLDQ
ncbi:diphthine--ammonia ligase [Echinicola vietnamensis]|uniref:PP-loop superfamily ATP-utilizing enzyme n=1 Tax=Echinicola vietnamensis (strain DSM 17526 / LMG 23754 / KMM 6221) TaxID=926556 RepID=L0G569_ECHVK|nr:diphthine--ammonia ligase [Echinicola vietnamensis]AGA79970.1 PP-loop superfamily ATP-utilizing enzyme [Echinicola vietnamensis DSM 17526]